MLSFLETLWFPVCCFFSCRTQMFTSDVMVTRVHVTWSSEIPRSVNYKALTITNIQGVFNVRTHPMCILKDLTQGWKLQAVHLSGTGKNRARQVKLLDTFSVTAVDPPFKEWCYNAEYLTVQEHYTLLFLHIKSMSLAQIVSQCNRLHMCKQTQGSANLWQSLIITSLLLHKLMKRNECWILLK